MGTLIIIPARAGSKGLPGKNMKKLGDKPLIEHTIEYALKIKKEDDVICVTTNDEGILRFCKNYSSLIVIRRPKYLANDKAGMSEVLLHAIKYFKKKRIFFQLLLLLQPTSPLRIVKDYNDLCLLLNFDTEMVVTVNESKSNPYFNLFEENTFGYLRKCKTGNYTCRQEVPKVFEYNGSMYLIKSEALVKFGLHGLKKVKKLILPKSRSVDIDDIVDWLEAEYYYNNTTFYN